MSNDLLQKAIELARRQNREAAIPLLVHIIKAEPENTEAWSCLLDMLADDQRRAVLSALVHKNLGGPAASEVLDLISAEDLKPYLASAPVEAAPEAEPIDQAAPVVDAVESSAGEWLPESETGPAPESDTAPDQEALPAPQAPAGEAAETPEAAGQVPANLEAQTEPPAAEPVVPEAAPGSPEEEHEDVLADLRALSAAGQMENETGDSWKPEWTAAAAAAQPAAEPTLSNLTASLRQDPGPALSLPVTRRVRRRNQVNCLVLVLVFLLILITASVGLAILYQNGMINLPFLPFRPAGFVESTPALQAGDVPQASATAILSLIPTATAEASAVPSAVPTSLPTATATPPPEPTATATAFAGQVLSSPKDGAARVFIPAGRFLMGWNFGDPGETSEHKVSLNAFWIDQTEVTNQMYAACVAAGACTAPAETRSYKRADYTTNPEFAGFPVVFVSWNQASAYCAWAGRRLPSEAEWEYAARGDDGRLYPWGKAAPSQELANFNFYFKDTVKAGSFPGGASPFGVLDMAGNAAEWVNDWYIESYYSLSPLENPPGPQEGMVKAYRGGSFANQADKIRSSRRSYDLPTYVSSSLGFRCALDGP